jgi:hypothetical protein
MTFARAEYDTIYRRLFGETANSDGGWERWQETFAANHSTLILQPHGMPALEPSEDDHWIFATAGSLRFLARIDEALVAQLPEAFVKFAEDDKGAKILANCGESLHAQARGFVFTSLVEGLVADPTLAMAAAIAWLISTMLQ